MGELADLTCRFDGAFPGLSPGRPPPDDELGAKVARGLLDGNEMRLRLTPDIFIPDANEDGLGRLEAALDLIVGAKDSNAKVMDAVRAVTLDREPRDILIARAAAQLTRLQTTCTRNHLV